MPILGCALPLSGRFVARAGPVGPWRSPFIPVDRKSPVQGQTDAVAPNRTLRAPRQELWYPPSNAMGGFNEAAALKWLCCSC